MATYPRRQHFGFWRVLAVAAVSLALLVSGLSPAHAETPTPQEQTGTGSVIGVVTGEGGAPVEGFRVEAYAWDSVNVRWATAGAGLAVTGADGGFAISGLPAGRYTVAYTRVWRSQYLDMWWGNRLSQADAEGFDIEAGALPFDASVTLIMGGKISGTVTAKAGGVVSGAVVGVFAPGVFLTEVVADVNGDYVVEGLPPGSYSVSFRGPSGSSWVKSWWDHAGRIGDATAIPIDPDSVVTGVDGVLAAPASITGRLLGADGSPLTEVGVSAWFQEDAAGEQWTQVVGQDTGADGTFTLGGLRAGRYRVRIAPRWIGEPKYAYQWWGGTAVATEAEIFDVPAEQSVSIGDATLLMGIEADMSSPLKGTTPVVGDRLSVTVAIHGSVVPTRSRQWFRDGALIPGVTGESYVVQPEDLGTRISAREDLTAPGYVPVSVDLGQTERVGLGSFEVIENLRAYGGAEAPGLALHVSGGHLEPEPTQASYQWLRNGVAISGQTASTYVTTNDDFGSRLSVVVTMTAPGYKPLTQTFEFGQVCYRESDVPPPVIVGERAAGSTLSVAPLPGPPEMVLKYQWWLGSPIPGATAPTLKLKKAYVGYPVMLTLTRTVAGCPQLASHSSAWGIPKVAMASTPKIAGTVARRHTLHVHRGSWTSGTRFSYRWYADGEAISSATHSTLRLNAGLVGKRITVVVTGKRKGYATVTRSSAATRPVR